MCCWLYCMTKCETVVLDEGDWPCYIESITIYAVCFIRLVSFWFAWCLWTKRITITVLVKYLCCLYIFYVVHNVFMCLHVFSCVFFYKFVSKIIDVILFYICNIQESVCEVIFLISIHVNNRHPSFYLRIRITFNLSANGNVLTILALCSLLSFITSQWFVHPVRIFLQVS